MTPRRRAEPAPPPAEKPSLSIEAQLGEVRLMVTVKGLDHRPLLSLVDEILGAVEGDKKEE